MPVSGIVLTLSPDARLRKEALDAVEGTGHVTVGELVERSLPVVTETDTMEEHEQLWNELAALPGVLQVRLAFHDFSDVEVAPPISSHAPLGRRNGG